MITRRSLVAALAVPCLLVATNAAAAGNAAWTCAAAKQKAAGKKVAGKMACYAKATKKGADVDQDCLHKVEDKFLAAFQKADAKGGCTTPTDAATVEATVDACVGELIGDTVTTTTTPDQTTTTTLPAEVQCAGNTYECGDTLDNDGDLLRDSADDECLGACDNSEKGYYPDIPGAAAAPCRVDCFWDNDTGSGNDDCIWDHHCDPHEVAPNFYPESSNGAACAYNPNHDVAGTAATCADLSAAQSSLCLSYCGPLVPNGCDCFGCCELPAGGGTYVWLGSVDGSANGTCNSTNVNDPTKCQPCQPVPACQNACASCEVCIGKTAPDSGCPAQTCPPGDQLCGQPGQTACPAGYSCVTGCCKPAPQ